MSRLGPHPTDQVEIKISQVNGRADGYLDCLHSATSDIESLQSRVDTVNMGTPEGVKSKLCYVGYDPGNYAGVVFMQPRKDGTIYKLQAELDANRTKQDGDGDKP